MTGARTVRCHTCAGAGAGAVGDGTGGGGRSKEALLRRELIRSWDVVGSYERFVGSIYETAGAAITEMAASLEKKDGEIAEMRKLNANLARELAVYKDELEGGAAAGGVGEDKPKMTRAEYRLKAAAYEAAKSGGDPAAAGRKKKTGGQAGHRGSSRTGPVDGTVRFAPELCDGCGRTDMETAEFVRKRVVDLAEARQKTAWHMHVTRVGQCPGCGTVTAPHTGAIPGTSFGPRLRAHVHAYRDGHATEGDIRGFLEELEDAPFSEGAISACVSAIAKHADGPVLAVPDGEPVALGGGDGDLRAHRSPLPPPDRPADTEYAALDAALTRRSNLWTSFLPQPAAVRIVERASMDPYACTDETGSRVGADRVQASVAETVHTSQVRIIKHRDAVTLEGIWGWMAGRPAMRDGTTGYEWHLRSGGALSRCMVHLLRDAEESAMEHGLGSPQYVRHREMRGVYRDASRVREIIMGRAGGPLACASRQGLVRSIPGLAAYIDGQIERLTGRVNRILERSPGDAVSTTMRNALPHMFTALRVPGMPLHNNGTELSVRDNVVVDRRRIVFPDMKGAYNFSVMRTVSATCRKNGVGICRATMMMAADPRWDVFNSGIPPPIFGTSGDGAVR